MAEGIDAEAGQITYEPEKVQKLLRYSFAYNVQNGSILEVKKREKELLGLKSAFKINKILFLCIKEAPLVTNVIILKNIS